MVSIARGQAANTSNALLDLFTRSGAFLVDAFAVAFAIFDISDDDKLSVPVQVAPGSGTTALNLVTDRLGLGHYAASWTPGSAVNIGRYRIVWTYQLTSTSAVLTASEDFEVLAAPPVAAVSRYALVADFRDEDIADDATATDARLATLIANASKRVDLVCGQFFDARAMQIALDGQQVEALRFNFPIIALGTATMDDELLDATLFKVYNRHITQGMLSPDDRMDPRLEFITSLRSRRHVNTIGVNPFTRSQGRFTLGNQNVLVDGVFGYTDPSSTSTVGETPALIREATMLLVKRQIPKLGDPDELFDAQQRHRLTSERTRDQSYNLGAGRGGANYGPAGPSTGDPLIDDILMTYMAPIRFAGV
jgi:hypothetical protein